MTAPKRVRKPRPRKKRLFTRVELEHMAIELARRVKFALVYLRGRYGDHGLVTNSISDESPGKPWREWFMDGLDLTGNITDRAEYYRRFPIGAAEKAAAKKEARRAR